MTKKTNKTKKPVRSRAAARYLRLKKVYERVVGAAPARCVIPADNGELVEWNVNYFAESERREVVVDGGGVSGELVFTSPAALRQQAAWLLEAARWLEGRDQ